MRKVNIRGKEFSVAESQNLFWDQVESNLWEPETFDILDQYVKPETFFLDLGAWNGVTSIYAQSLGATPISLEPDAEIFPVLHANLRANNCSLHYPNAISDENGVKYLNSSGSFGDSMSSLIDRPMNKLSKGVDCYTLEKFFEVASIRPADVSLIKIDIEGGEVLVLKQAKEFLKLHKPTIYISLHPAWFPNEKEDMQMIMDTIFPIYSVCRMINGIVTQYTRDNFLKAVERGEHSYILLAK